MSCWSPLTDGRVRIENLQPNTSYTLFVRAKNQVGVGQPTEITVNTESISTSHLASETSSCSIMFEFLIITGVQRALTSSMHVKYINYVLLNSLRFFLCMFICISNCYYVETERERETDRRRENMLVKISMDGRSSESSPLVTVAYLGLPAFT